MGFMGIDNPKQELYFIIFLIYKLKVFLS